MRKARWNFSVFAIQLLIYEVNAQLSRITIGAIFEANSDFNESSQILQYAVDEANDKILQASGMKLDVEFGAIKYGREYAVSKRVCNLMELGVGVIFGPKFPSSAYHAMNLCDAKEIPYVNIHMDADAATKLTVLNMYPSQDSLIQLLVDYLNATNWKSITILYESPLWLSRVSKFLETNNNNVGARITVKSLDYTMENEFRSTMQSIRDSDVRNIVLDCSIEPLPKILQQAMQVGLMTKDYRWIITNLDAHTVDLEPFKYSGTNITTFRIFDMNHPLLSIDKPKDNLENFDDIDENADDNSFPVQTDDFYGRSCTTNPSSSIFIPTYPDKLNTTISLRSSLIYDSVMVFAMVLQQLGPEQVMPIQIMCNDKSSTWNKGYTILNYMKNTKYDGLSGKIEFDNVGLRSNISVEILELGSNGLEIVGLWKYGFLNPLQRLSIKRAEGVPVLEDDIENSIKNKTLIVVTALSEPYTMHKQEAESLEGNDRYEGYAVDLIQELALLLEFNYIFVLEEDGNYGECVNNITNEWDGMIGKVMAGRADIAITDLTVTSDRIKALEFTPSIMNLGIAILYQVPRKVEPSTFSFMAPFASEVWIVLVTAYVFVSLCFFCLGRISPSQWENPYPCVEEPAHLENQFSLLNSFWFAAGAILQQGSEIEVKAASIRLASAVWWFFTLIIVSSYTANLAAFLVVENKVDLIKNVEDFANCGLPEQPKCKATFGVKKGGSTFKFFQESKYPTFVNMYNVMKHHPEVLVEENHEGLQRVQTENYAYLMESTSLNYYTERICNVTQVGGLIDDRNYAIGMKKGYKYYNELSAGVLKLQERGLMDKLHTKWWKSKRGGGACNKKESSDAEGLKMDHLEGVFLILTYGTLIAFFYGVIDAIIIIRNRATAAKIPFKEEMKIECDFLMESLVDPDKPKPVRMWRKRARSMKSINTNRSSET